MANEEKLSDSNVPFAMTPTGVLAADGRRSMADTQNMTSEDLRNSMIVDLSKYFPKERSFQGYTTDDLVITYAMVIVLKKYFGCSVEWFHARTVDEARNGLIDVLDRKTHVGVPSLQAMPNGSLVEKAKEWYTGSKTVTSISNLIFEQDNKQFVEQKPTSIDTEYVTNLSSVAYKKTVTLTGKTTKQSSFTSTTGLSFSYSTNISAKLGIPEFFEIGGGSEFSFGANQQFELGKSSSIERSHSSSVEVTVPPGKYLKLEMTSVALKMKVKWSADITTKDGLTTKDSGVWYGVDCFRTDTTMSEIRKDLIPSGAKVTNLGK